MSEDLSKEERGKILAEMMRLDQEAGLYDEPFTNPLIKERLENSNYYKMTGIAPDGFILIPHEVIDLLDDFEEWKDFKYRKLEWIEEKSKQVLKTNKETYD
jgi:hypothetical protein